MNPPSELFRGRGFEVFSRKEINEMVLGMYRELGIALRDHTETLILDRKALSHLDRSGIIHKLPMVYGSTSIYEWGRKSLLSILERDELVQQYFQLDQVTDDCIKVKVLKSD